MGQKSKKEMNICRCFHGGIAKTSKSCMATYKAPTKGYKECIYTHGTKQLEAMYIKTKLRLARWMVIQ